MGWEYGLPTMKMGEVATLYIRPEYAYGNNGFFDVIPPGATLVIEVQLYGWRGKVMCIPDLDPLTIIIKQNVFV